MGLKIYREINNNNASNKDNNILLEFVCSMDLWDATDIFENCLHYDSDEEELAEVSEVYHDRLSVGLDCLKRRIEYSSNNQTYRPDSMWFQEAQRCCEILSKELNNRTDGFYMLFIK